MAEAKDLGGFIDVSDINENKKIQTNYPPIAIPKTFSFLLYITVKMTYVCTN
jgi:hypothetical protein